MKSFRMVNEIEGLVQDCIIANALELLQSCTKSSKYCGTLSVKLVISSDSSISLSIYYMQYMFVLR